ncbi:MAG: HD-GYP domain-containing protein [Nevskiales bacterium]
MRTAPGSSKPMMNMEDENKQKRPRVLICDDSIANGMLLASLLEEADMADTHAIIDPLRTADEIRHGDYDLLMLDIEMPGMNGFEVMAQLFSEGLIDESFPILILTGHQDAETRNKALSAGAADYVNKPFDQNEVVLRVKHQLRVRAAYQAKVQQAEKLERMVEQRTASLTQATDILIERLAKAGELRDSETGKHVLRVGLFARVLAEGAGLPQDICFMIEKAAPLHDLGKIGIPDNILLKKGRLDADERKVMDQHARIGAELLESHESMLVNMASSIALSHHERWDGKGYPEGLAGESIPIEGRITAISDVFDALTTERPYKKAWPVEEAIAEIKNEAGKHFDPALVDIFEKNLERILEIKENYRD